MYADGTGGIVQTDPHALGRCPLAAMVSRGQGMINTMSRMTVPIRVTSISSHLKTRARIKHKTWPLPSVLQLL
jgi:hypothetical protein